MTWFSPSILPVFRLGAMYSGIDHILSRCLDRSEKILSKRPDRYFYHLYLTLKGEEVLKIRSPQRQFSEISVRKTIRDLEFSEHFIVKFLASLPLLGFSNS